MMNKYQIITKKRLKHAELKHSAADRQTLSWIAQGLVIWASAAVSVQRKWEKSIVMQSDSPRS